VSRVLRPARRIVGHFGDVYPRVPRTALRIYYFRHFFSLRCWYILIQPQHTTNKTNKTKTELWAAWSRHHRQQLVAATTWRAPLAQRHRPSTIQARRADASVSSWNGSAVYLMNSCTPTADVAGRQHLRSASQRKLIVPRYRLNSFGHRCFAVAGPSTWNSLRDSLRDPALSLDMFRRQLETFFCEILTRCTQRIRDFSLMSYINLHFTYLLTHCSYPRRGALGGSVLLLYRTSYAVRSAFLATAMLLVVVFFLALSR